MKLKAKRLATPGPAIERDRWGRPLVVPPGGGTPVAYTRATTFVGAIEDTYKLGQWQQRHAVRGAVLHQDLAEAIRATDPANKSELDRLVDEAKERSGAGDAARIGTYLHSLTEAADRGQDPATVPVPWVSTGDLNPQDYAADVAAYQEVTADMTALHLEQFTVQDKFKIGGTPDRVVAYGGKRYIADLKTGSIEWGALKIAAQLAVYARSRPYDVATGERLDYHGAEVDRGIVIHLPAGTGTCRLFWVDLQVGWEAVLAANTVRRLRSTGSFRKVMAALEPSLEPIHPPTQVDDLTVAIETAKTAEDVRNLWRASRDRWTNHHTELAKARTEALTNTTTQGAPA